MRICNILSLFIILILSLGASGCQKSPINGDLDGQWQIMEVYPEAPYLITQERLYYCFSLHTTQLTYYGSGPWASGNILKFDDTQLILEFPDVVFNRNKLLLKQYAIYSNPVTFEIELLTKNSLILRDGDVVVTLRKF